MQYDGFMEGNDGLYVEGWAIDFSRPDDPVEVELELSNGWVTTILADRPRSDLPKKIKAGGRHGFRCRLPDAVRNDRNYVVTGRIKHTDFVLHRSPLPVRPIPLLEVIAGDIVSNCNLRCPFCIVDYEKVKGLQLMPKSTFERTLALLPLVKDGNFWLSCMHEPSLHPEFIEYIEAVPLGFRRKVSFTSNFCKKLNDDFLRRLAESGIHSIRVSFDSMTPELFAQYRKGGRLEVFLDNLRRFSEFLRQSAHAPLLHIITMVFKENIDEVPALVRRCRDEFGSGLHEVRFMYYSPHLADWGAEHIVSMEQWHRLKAEVGEPTPGHRLDWSDPPADIHQQFAERPGVEAYQHPPAVFGGTFNVENYPRTDPLVTGFPIPDEDLRVRMRWDGLLMAEQIPEHEFRMNVLDLPDPVEYFRNLRAAADKQAAAQMTSWKRQPAQWSGSGKVLSLEDQLGERDSYIHKLHLQHEERARELQAARADAEALAQLLQKAEAERDALDKKLQRLKKSPVGWLAEATAPAAPNGRSVHSAPRLSVEFKYFLHTSLFRVFDTSEIQLRGWLFPVSGKQVEAVRAVVDDIEYTGTYGLEESEVLRVHGPLAHNPKPGFSIRVQFTKPRQQFSLEAKIEGQWCSVLNTPVWAKQVQPVRT